MKVPLICVALWWSGFALADMPLSVYQKSRSAELVRSYVTGVGQGMLWLNEAAQVKHNRSLFCIPPRLALDEGIIQSLLEQEIRSPAGGKTYGPDIEIELILYNALVSRFPCQVN